MIWNLFLGIHLPMVDGFINVYCMNHANNILAAIWFLAVIYILMYKTRLCIITLSSHIFSPGNNIELTKAGAENL